MPNKKDSQINFSLTEEIADVIRERILRGEYEIGEKIKENQIAAELNVSRTPIREAFKMLEIEGLIDYIANRGCFAKGFTKQDVSDIYTVREVLEELAVRWSVERITPAELVRLEEHCELMEFYTKKRDTRKVLEMNTEFHDIIYNSARSRFLAQVLRSYKEYLDKTRKTVFYDKEFLDDIQAEHRELIEGIKARDVDRALAAIYAHLEASKARTEAVWNLK